MDRTQDRQGDGVVTAQGQRDHVVFEDLVVGLFDNAHGVEQVEGVDRHVADIGHGQGIKGRSARGHVVRTNHHRLGADFARPEAGARAQRGADVQRDANKSGIQASGGSQVG